MSEYSSGRLRSREEIEAGRSPKGGWTREQLTKWGVPWPPKKGWKSKLEHEDLVREWEGR